MSPGRGLTQSEKHRMFVDRPDDENSTKPKQGIRPKVVGSRVMECPRNIIEERKLKKHLAKLEHERQRKEEELTNQKHMLRMDHKNFLGESNLMPGFRFHRNGDTKGGDKREHNKAQSLSKKTMSAPVVPPSPTTLTNRLLIGEQIEALKKELRRLKNSKTKSSQEGIPARIQSNKVYIRAHTNDSPFNRPGTRSPTSSPRKYEGSVYNVSAERFCRRTSRPNCIACECTFHSAHALDDGKKIPELRLKWRSPPKGYFLKTLSTRTLSPSSSESTVVKSRRTLQSSTSTPLDKSGLSISLEKQTGLSVENSKQSGLSLEKHSRPVSPLEKERKQHRAVPLSKAFSGPPGAPTSHSPPDESPKSPPPPSSVPLRLVSDVTGKRGQKSPSTRGSRSRAHMGDGGGGGSGTGKLQGSMTRSGSVLNSHPQYRASGRRLHSPSAIKSQMERDEEILRGKVQEFVASLPAVKPAIRTWRPVCGTPTRSGLLASHQQQGDTDDQALLSQASSRTRLHPKTSDDDEDGAKAARTIDPDHTDPSSITWARYDPSHTGASRIMSDIYLAHDQEPPTPKTQMEIAAAAEARAAGAGAGVESYDPYIDPSLTQPKDIFKEFAREARDPTPAASPSLRDDDVDVEAQQKAFQELLQCRYLRIPPSILRAWE